jgi:hypothetical protein
VLRILLNGDLIWVFVSFFQVLLKVMYHGFKFRLLVVAVLVVANHVVDVQVPELGTQVLVWMVDNGTLDLMSSSFSS